MVNSMNLEEKYKEIANNLMNDFLGVEGFELTNDFFETVYSNSTLKNYALGVELKKGKIRLSIKSSYNSRRNIAGFSINSFLKKETPIKNISKELALLFEEIDIKTQKWTSLEKDKHFQIAEDWYLGSLDIVYKEELEMEDLFFRLVILLLKFKNNTFMKEEDYFLLMKYDIKKIIMTEVDEIECLFKDKKANVKELLELNFGV
jgi:hypothetical protein